MIDLNKPRLTEKYGGGFGLVKVKDDEQEVESPYPNTLKAILECFNRLGELENAIEDGELVPVVRGEWIAEQKGAEYCEFRCSACDGSVGQTDQFDETEVKQFSEWYKYCPNCGSYNGGDKA